MKKLLFFLITCVVVQNIFSQGCTIIASVPRDTIVCGERVSLTAFGQGQGIAVLSENFNNGTYGPGWAATQQVLWNNPCSPNGADGTTHIWMGNSSPVPRILATTSFNLSSCANAGVTLCFDMLFAEQGNNAPCEGPDEPQEGVYVQYSIDNGATWVNINYFDPNGGNDPLLVNWNNWCFPIPQAALTANTKFRWFQDADSGADYDHWGIDNVAIYCNDPSYNIVWTHDGFNAGPVGGVNPTPVGPNVTTSYVVVMSNGTVTCRDTVTLNVVNPTVNVNAGNDTAVCNGQCATLNATAKVIQKPAKTPTYTNQEQATITGTPGFPGFPPFIPSIPGTAFLNMDINITNLNQATVTNGYITSVCIGSLNMVLFSGIEIFDIWLVCPSGDSVLLVKDSTLTGNSLTNTCFVPAGANITSATSPYTGSYAPNQSFNGLSGCDANGVWSLHFQALFNGFSLPTGTFNSWSISFNDPEVFYTGNFNWAPTTNKTGSTTLNPTICLPPNTTTAYTLTLSDTAGCVTQSDLINVTTQPCCNFTATASPTQATCGLNDGSVNVAVSPVGNHTYAWSDGLSTSSTRSGLAAGTYTVTITDQGGCSTIATAVVNSTGGPTLVTSTTSAGCNTSTGSATVTLSSGTATSYEWSSGATTATASNLAAGTYTVTVYGAGNCNVTASATVSSAGGLAITLSSTNTNCGSNNGTATVTVTQGTATTYSWSTGATTASVSNLAVGTITVTVSDVGGCSTTGSATIGNSSGNNVVITTDKDLMCTEDSAHVCAPTGYVAYLWNNGGTNECVYAKQAGNYYVTVTDNGGCTATSNQLAINFYPQPPVSLSVNSDSLLGYNSVSYQWYKDGVVIPGGDNPLFVATESGSYTVLITDEKGCTAFSLPVEITVTTTGINNLLHETMSVYPNPINDGNFNISVSNGWLGATCEVFDAEGRLVHQSEIKNQKSQIELNVARGAYMLRVTLGSKTINQKLIKL